MKTVCRYASKSIIHNDSQVLQEKYTIQNGYIEQMEPLYNKNNNNFKQFHSH